MSLLAGAGSAAVAAVIGGRLGVSGTVAGAAVGSIVAAVTATTIRSSVHRSRAAAIRLAKRKRAGLDPTPAESVAVEHADPAPEKTPWSGWVRRGVTVGAGFALGIAGLLGVQLGLGRYLSPGTEQLQVAAAKVVAAGPTTGSSTRAAHPTATATTTVTETAPSTATPSSSSTASQTADPVKGPIGSPVPTASTTPSATQTPSAAVATP
ncbi:MAG TPA: hypothetical protein VIK31_05405 [Propionibacteriaceae bacterium]